MADETDEGLLEIRLHELGDLFNALDPSPLVDRDLDDEVETWLVDYALTVPHEAPLRLRIHVHDRTHAEAAQRRIGEIGEAVRHHFGYAREREAHRLRILMREGRDALLVGLVFLVLCSMLSEIAGTFLPGPAGAFLKEGLIIIGWVAMWRPVEIFLYEWRPMRRRIRVLSRLGAMGVDLAPPPPPKPPP